MTGDLGQPLVVHVEDDDSDAKMVDRSMRRSGRSARIVRAVDGRQGLRLIDAMACGELEAPALILLDLKLPFASGIEVLERARSLPTLSAIPIVILTSSDVDQDRRRCAELGCTDYVVKPIDYYEFQAALNRLWDRYIP